MAYIAKNTEEKLKEERDARSNQPDIFRNLVDNFKKNSDILTFFKIEKSKS